MASAIYKLNKTQGCETPAITRKKYPLIPLKSVNRRTAATTATTSDSSDNDVESVIPRGMKKSTCTDFN